MVDRRSNDVKDNGISRTWTACPSLQKKEQTSGVACPRIIRERTPVGNKKGCNLNGAIQAAWASDDGAVSQPLSPCRPASEQTWPPGSTLMGGSREAWEARARTMPSPATRRSCQLKQYPP